VQDDRTKWEGLAQVVGPAGAMTSEDLHWRKERRCNVAAIAQRSRGLLGQKLHIWRGLERSCCCCCAILLVLTCRRPRNFPFPHGSERRARDLSRVPNFHAARYGTRLRLAGMLSKRT
jgi:hypothetical protein